VSDLVIFGAWHFSRVVAEAAAASGRRVLGFVDPDPPPGIATLEQVPQGCEVFVAIGDNVLRRQLSRELLARGRRLATLVHPAAVVSPSAALAPGCFVAELVAVRSNAVLQEGVVLQAGSVVSHDVHVGAFASFGPNAACASKSRIGALSAIGVGASLLPGIVVGEGCTVAAGAAVFRDAADGVTLVGNPARATRPTGDAGQQSRWTANAVW